MIYSKNFPRCARQFIDNYFEKLWKIVDIFKISCAARANMLRVVKDFWSKIMKNNTNNVQLLHSNFKRRMMKTSMVYVKSFRAARADLSRISTQRIPRGRDRILSTQRIYRGAENSSCSGAKTFYIKFVMLDLSGQNKDRRITSQPTFQVHLLGLLGKTGWLFFGRTCLNNSRKPEKVGPFECED